MSSPPPRTPSPQDALATWYRRHARDLPWRRAEFAERFGAWGTLVSEFMLQQTPVTRVIPHLEAWLQRWPTPTAQAAATPAETVTQWANLGYPRRALWLHRTAVTIRDVHAGVVPSDVAALLALPGIGDYTARAVAVFAYGQHHPVVDTNTRRVLTRLQDGRAQPGPPARRDLEVMDTFIADRPDSAMLNAATMELGATVCVARGPRCAECPVRHACAWRRAGYPETEDTRRRQARYEGSDRQARGAILRALRGAGSSGLAAESLIADWPDPVQRGRALASLLSDGLIEIDEERAQLPGA